MGAARQNVIVLLMVMVPSIALAQDYVDRVRGKRISEGVGIEGVITVFDETPRMFSSLGSPRTEVRYPLWYFYDDGDFKLTLRAEYTREKFMVRTIEYSDDRGQARALRTGEGITLGDPVTRVIEVYGAAPEVNAGAHRYPAWGVSFKVGGKPAAVTSITVFRPNGAPVRRRTPLVAPSPPKPVVAPAPAQPTPRPTPRGPAELGLDLPPSPAWRPVGEVTLTHGVFQSADGALELIVDVCSTCAGGADATVVEALTKRYGPNRLSPVQTRPPRAEVLRLGARRAYLARYGAPFQRGTAWAYVLAGRRGHLQAVLRLVATRPTAAQLSGLVAVLRGLRLSPSTR